MIIIMVQSLSTCHALLVFRLNCSVGCRDNLFNKSCQLINLLLINNFCLTCAEFDFDYVLILLRSLLFANLFRS